MEPIVRPYNPNGAGQPLITYMQDPQGNWVPVIAPTESGALPPQPMVNGPEAPQMQMPPPQMQPMPAPQLQAPMGPGAPMPQPGAAPVAPPMGMPAPAPMPMGAPGTPPGMGNPAPPAPQGTPFPGGATVEGPPTATPEAMPQGMPPELDGLHAGPAKTPEEAQVRKNGWMTFIEGIKSDPQKMAMLLHLGTKLVQPTPPGQTHLGHFGNAVGDSQNYLQALRAQEFKNKETQADIDLKTAQTGTEKGKPAVQTATVGQIQAGTAKDKAETQTIEAIRGGLTSKLQGEIENLKSNKLVDEARAALLNAQAKSEPGKAAEEIELMKAHSWYYRNPSAHAKAVESARMQSVESLAKAFVGGGDPQLTELFKTDPETAMNKARVQAQAGQVGSYWASQAEQGQADEIHSMYSTMYDRLKATNNKQVKDMTKEEFIINKLMVSSTPPSVNSKIMALMGPGKKGAPAPGAPANRGSQSPGGVPEAPSGVPSGSAYSPSRKQWKSPDGRLFDESGKAVK